MKADEFTEFCNSTVPLARLTRRVFTNTEKFVTDVELANFGAEPLDNVKAVWRIDATSRRANGTHAFTPSARTFHSERFQST